MSHAPVDGGLISGIVPSSVSTGKRRIIYLSILTSHTGSVLRRVRRIYLNREESALRIKPAIT